MNSLLISSLLILFGLTVCFLFYTVVFYEEMLVNNRTDISFRLIAAWNRRHDYYGVYIVEDCIIAGFCSVITKCVMAPLERIQLLLQVQDSSTQISVKNRYRGIREYEL